LNYTDEFNKIIEDVSGMLGKPIHKDKYKVIDRGLPHNPQSLPVEMMGVYTFLYNGSFLKIGKAGPKSNARFFSQHYNPKSAQSTLAASILTDENMKDQGVTEDNIGEWIKNNCHRIDILLDVSLGIFALEFVEAVLHYKYEPIYEGFVTQR
jgi:fructose-1,6-bisphosphatase